MTSQLSNQLTWRVQNGFGGAPRYIKRGDGREFWPPENYGDEQDLIDLARLSTFRDIAAEEYRAARQLQDDYDMADFRERVDAAIAARRAGEGTLMPAYIRREVQ